MYQLPGEFSHGYSFKHGQFRGILKLKKSLDFNKNRFLSSNGRKIND